MNKLEMPNMSYTDIKRQKRHIADNTDSTHPTKRRLIEHLSDLKLSNLNNNSNISNDNNAAIGNNINNPGDGNIRTVFGYLDKNHLNRPINDPHRVIINNIDQFLRENPDQFEIIGERIQNEDLKSIGLDKLIVSCGLNIKDTWKKLISEYENSSKMNASKDDRGADGIFKNLIWQEYLKKYFSLIKYHDPLKIVWENYKKWLERKENGNKIIELDNDGDEMMTDDGGDSSYDKVSVGGSGSNLPDGMSCYGSYYSHHEDGHPDDFRFFKNHDRDRDLLVEDVDDDVMMID